MVDSSDRAFVLDFGLARQIESQKSVTGLILGTPAYMPPEQAIGGTVEVRSDVYSLGATLYELLGNAPPFRGENIYETLDKVVTREPEPLIHVAADLRTIVFKCLMKEVSGRYSTAANLAEDLRRWMEGEPILAHPPSLLYRLRKKARKWRAVLVVALCGLLTASGISVFVIPRWLRADRAESLKEFELTTERAERARAERGLALARPHLDEGRRLEARLDRLLTTETWTSKEVQSLIEQAQREFDRVLSIDPKHPDALLEKARVFQYDNNRMAALDYCTRAIEAASGYATARLQRARLWLDQYEDLRQGSGRYVRLDTPEGLSLAAKIRTDLNEVLAWSKDDREVTFATGALAFVEGDYENATRALEEYSKLTLSDYRGWEWTSHAWLHIPGMEMRAIGAIDEAIKYRPRLPSLYVFRGTARLQQAIRLKRLSETDKAALLRTKAMEDFRVAREIDPLNPGAHRGLGEACLESGEGSLAAVHFTQAIGLNPKGSAAFVGRARSRFRDGDIPGAQADAEEALRLGSVDPKSYVIRGRARCAREDLAGALSDLNLALQLDPREPEAIIGLGDLKRERGDAAGAIADFDRALALDPVLAEAFQHRGKAQRELGSGDQANLDLGKALKLDPGNPWIHLDCGVCAVNRREWSDALTDFRKGLARMPSDPWPFWMNIWIARSHLGEAKEAREELEASAGELSAANPEKLPSTIVALVLGRMTTRDFLETLDRVPRSRGDTAQACFYAAEKALFDGDLPLARTLLLRCSTAKAVTTQENSMAASELKQLPAQR
jgi:tetratricopeptide (TPR) repeat protein